MNPSPPAPGAETAHPGPGSGGIPWTRDIRFNPEPRDLARVNEIVIHETVTYSTEATVKVLARRGFSTAIIIDPSGPAHLVAELDTRALHCHQHNGPSVGIDVVNPYYPPIGESELWPRHIKAPWADRGFYTLPTLASMSTLVDVVRYLAGPAGAIPCPMHFVGLVGDRFAMRKLADANVRRPGIWSHQQAGDHADGSWPALVCYLVLVVGMGVVDAYEEAARVATGARGWCALPSVAPPAKLCPTCGQVAP